jgi:hypothetical protein
MVGIAAVHRVLAMASIFNLNGHASYAHVHIGNSNSPFLAFDMSLSNIVVIVLMLIVFAVAILAPFPSHRAGGGSS